LKLRESKRIKKNQKEFKGIKSNQKGGWGKIKKAFLSIPPQIFLVFLGFYRLSLPDITVQGHVQKHHKVALL